MTWVKICGIRGAEAALAAVAAGADALGFIFVPGVRRYIDPTAARAIIRAVPRRVARVGVFLDAGPAEVAEVYYAAGLSAVQLQGNEPPDYIQSLAQLGVEQVIKAFRLRGPADLQWIPRYHAAAAVLVEALVPGQSGGTGQALDLELAAMAGPHASGGRLILAGGLTSDTVAEAMRQVSPWGVDVSSGVESDGRKDPAKIVRFIEAVRGSKE